MLNVQCPQPRYSITVFETHLGWMGIRCSLFGLQRIVLPCHSRSEVLEQIAESCSPAWSEDFFLCQKIAVQMKDYLEGKQIEFHCLLDLRGLTMFTKRVLKVVRAIPYGQTRSYSWIAGALRLPGGARAVGQALAKNPLPIVVPCHRVINSDGSLGGFSGGIELKKYLVELERRSL